MNYYLFKGHETKVSQNWSWTCETFCQFEYTWYPFDVQNCNIHIEIFGDNLQLRLIDVTYSGNVDLGKYFFRNLGFCSTDKFGRRGTFVDISFARPLTGNFMTLYMPTLLLLLISQMSTIFSKTFLDVVIEVNVTLLLVLTTL